MRKKIGKLLLEIIPVMVGVFLGFLVSSWADANKKGSQTAVLRKNIVGEMQSNSKKIRNVLAYHEMLRDSSRYYLSNFSPAIKPNFFEGVRVSPLTRSAFETGVQTGLINGFSFEKIQKINDLYTRQDNYGNMINLLFTGLINVTMNTDESETGMRKVLQFLAMSMTDIVIHESELLNEYNRLLKEL